MGNGLEGSIPKSLVNLGNLENLDLSVNKFSGGIPEEFGNFQKLVYMVMSDNKLSDIPMQIGECLSLKQLDLADNQLNGSLPTQLFELLNLTDLYLNNNTLIGTIPALIGNLNSVETLTLYHNNLHGEIPKEIGLLGKLQNFYLYENQFSGEIPLEIGNCSSLQMLDFFGNQFTGRIPVTIGRLKNLKLLHLRQNDFSREIPSTLGNCKELTILDLADNHFSGGIPKTLGFLESMEQLMLYNNSLEDLSINSLTGIIPPELSSCKKLTHIDLDNNLLDGLLVLSLDKNSLNGTLPPEIGDLSSLKVLNLERNQFYGQIPATISKLSKLYELRLSQNRFDGDIPAELGQLHDLQSVLDLGNNNLTGGIPPSIGILSKLEGLDLSHNELVGKIPSQIGGMSSLGRLDLSYNNLQGELDEQLSHWPADVFAGNFKLCGRPLVTQCNTEDTEHVRSRLSTSSVVAITATLTLAGVVILLLVGLILVSRRKHQWEDIMEATHDLSDEYIIGSGGFGTIYKAELPSGEIVAVKKILRKDDPFMDRSFAREIQTLGRIRHGHLESTTKKVGINLDWEIRLKIAVGLAQGVEYLHHDCVPKIIHRDIKILTWFAGSYGYIAPEYAYTLKATEKSDVYSMGIVLMELVTGRMPTARTFGVNIDMVRWVESHMEMSALTRDESVDPALKPLLPKEESGVFQLLDIATVPAERPTSRQVCDHLFHISNTSKMVDSEKKTIV
ncbi:hypothetical protein C5167_008638 [Papaver somniferum]|uniref:non-specific serine/threonine protein kinase n=1 Tax=Papaver somniferum TaxID=3469 RepID=A0A4Y7JWK3_PAPSO|nr:hypothetical protein C5167_008638 [Papaver somniferum]